MMFPGIFVAGLSKRVTQLGIVSQTLHSLGKLVGVFRFYAYSRIGIPQELRSIALHVSQEGCKDCLILCLMTYARNAKLSKFRRHIRRGSSIHRNAHSIPIARIHAGAHLTLPE